MNFLMRALSAAVLVPLVVWAVFVPNNLVWSGTLFLVLQFSFFEYAKLVSKDGQQLRMLFQLLASAYFTIGILFPYTTNLFIFLLISFIGIFCLSIMYLPLSKPALSKILLLWMGLIYVATPLLLASWIKMGHSAAPESVGSFLVMATLLSSWTNDTFAYFGGKAFGKRPLAPEISPKKTWEGFIIGFLGSIFGTMMLFLVFSTYWPSLVESLKIFQILLLSMVIGVLSPLGDLAESVLKRLAGEKDSGNLIPGHGGFLDRIDGLLFSIPATYAFSLIVWGLF